MTGPTLSISLLRIVNPATASKHKSERKFDVHGLKIRALQNFICATYGQECWQRIVRAAGADCADFNPFEVYSTAVANKLVKAATEVLSKSECDLAEDVGIYLASRDDRHAIYRLLRFGGSNFLEFLRSLDDLPARAQLAVNDFELPRLDLAEHDTEAMTLIVRGGERWMGGFFCGLVRAMADHFGALATLENLGRDGNAHVIKIHHLTENQIQTRQLKSMNRLDTHDD